MQRISVYISRNSKKSRRRSAPHFYESIPRSEFLVPHTSLELPRFLTIEPVSRIHDRSCEFRPTFFSFFSLSLSLSLSRSLREEIERVSRLTTPLRVRQIVVVRKRKWSRAGYPWTFAIAVDDIAKEGQVYLFERTRILPEQRGNSLESATDGDPVRSRRH